MRYLLISGPVGPKAEPVLVYLEDGDKITIYPDDDYEAEVWPEVAKLLKINSLEDVIEKQGYTYYSTEIGDYSGDKKAEIDKIIDNLK